MLRENLGIPDIQERKKNYKKEKTIIAWYLDLQ